jgi:hypothetical protein
LDDGEEDAALTGQARYTGGFTYALCTQKDGFDLVSFDFLPRSQIIVA